MEIYHKTYKTCKTFIRDEAAPHWNAAGKHASWPFSHVTLKIFVLLSFVCFVITNTAFAQNEPVRIAFWNMENFFDPFVDSTKTYNAFTEDGMQHWTQNPLLPQAQ